eukprot:676998-Ditylum_brightwellii.AAC.1
MSDINSDADETQVTSKRHHFELTATCLLSLCPLLKKFPSGTKHDAIEISDITASGFGTKPSTNTSVVNLRYHTAEEYELLSQPQNNKF